MWKKLLLGGTVAVAACATLGLATSRAHHAFATEFDDNRPVNLQGRITRVEWINPHSWIHLEVKNADGAIQNWIVEGGTPNMLLRRGLTKDALAAGTQVTVRGYQSKDGSCKPVCRATGRNITFSDGLTLFIGSPREGAPEGREPGEKEMR